MNKKMLSAMVTMLAAMVMSLQSFADTENVDGIEWTYTITDGEATVGGGDWGDNAVPQDTSGAITIPSTLGKCPVTRIGNTAFWNCRELTGITIPSGIKSIGDGAFVGCNNLSISVAKENANYRVYNGCLMTKDCTTLIRGINCDVSIPSSVTNIAEYAFDGCGDLTSIEIPSNVVSIGDYAFYGCDGLGDLTISEGVQDIGHCAFEDCVNLTSVEIPPSVISIGSYAFSGCDRLVGLTISEGVQDIGEYAFAGCSGLTSVSIPSSVGYVGWNAFEYCSGLSSVEIAEGVWGVCSYAFYGCESLTDVTIPASVILIGMYAFSECSSLTDVTIPASVKTIGDGAFAECYGLTNMMFNGSLPRIGRGAFDCNWYGEYYDSNPFLTIHTAASPLTCSYIDGIPIVFDNYSEESLKAKTTVLVVTNVIVHYIRTSEVSPMAAPITKDVGIVNVMTEIKGGNISIPDSWVTNYPSFKATFGSDFSDALIAETGKFDAGGKPMMVWQDYVAGTDPTDKDDVFKASVTIVEGVPVISYTPTLSDAEAAKRKYTTWGKVKLQDEKWVEVKSGTEVDYNFFKVTVEMK